MKIFPQTIFCFQVMKLIQDCFFIIKINIRDCFLLYGMSSHFASQMYDEATPKLIAVFDKKKQKKLLSIKTTFNLH